MPPPVFQPYEPDTRSLLGLMQEQTRNRADAIDRGASIRALAMQQRGQNNAALLTNVGQLAAGALAQTVAASEQRKQERQEKENEAWLIQHVSESKQPPVGELIARFGEKRAADMMGMFKELRQADLADEQRTKDLFASDLRGVLALPAGMRPTTWNGIRQRWQGVGAPAEWFGGEQYDDQIPSALLAKLGQAPKPEPGFTLGQGDTRFDAQGNQIANVPKPEPPPKEEKLHPVVVRGPNGRPIRKMVPESELIKGVEEYREPQAPRAPEPLESVMVNGEAKLVPRSQAIGMTPATNRERTTEDERKSVGWYRQMRDAAATIDALEDQLTEKELFQIQTLPHESLVGMINRNQLSEAAKRYFRAFTQFSEARLRSVSGAAISTGEYQSDRQTYGKQFGETPEIAADRKRAREVVIDATRSRAGVAMPRESDAGGVVPGAVSDALKAVPDGRHTLSDGSVWIKQGGQIRKGS
jgi:hypothetical protein